MVSSWRCSVEAGSGVCTTFLDELQEEAISAVAASKQASLCISDIQYFSPVNAGSEAEDILRLLGVGYSAFAKTRGAALYMRWRVE